MTREEIEKLEGEALNAAVAEYVMGECPHVLTADARPGTGERSFKCSRCGQTGFDYLTDFEGRLLCALYSSDIAAARRMEDAIAKGTEQLHHAYTVMLSQVVMGIAGWQDWRDTWAIIRATPEQRCRAALLAVFAAPAPAAGRGER